MQRAKKVKAAGVCSNGNCTRPAAPGRKRCAVCAASVAASKARLIAAGVCTYCLKNPIAETSKHECAECLERRKAHDKERRGTPAGKLIGNIASATNHVAAGRSGGQRFYSSKKFEWTHQDFVARFGPLAGRVIDHLIPKRALDDDGQIDTEIVPIITCLDNINPTTGPDNRAKGHGLDKTLIQRAATLRQKGINGALLVPWLCAEMHRQGATHPNQSAIVIRAIQTGLKRYEVVPE
jgi:hypothetical protein